MESVSITARRAYIDGVCVDMNIKSDAPLEYIGGFCQEPREYFILRIGEPRLLFPKDIRCAKRTQIIRPEMLAALTAQIHWRRPGCKVTHYVDNTVAPQRRVKGYSRQCDCNHVIGDCY